MYEIAFEQETLARFYNGCSQTMLMVLSEYSTNYTQIISSLKDAYNAGLDELKKSIHYNASTFSYVGFPLLYANCKLFDKACEAAPDVSAVATLFNQLIQNIHLSGSLVREEIKRLELKAA